MPKIKQFPWVFELAGYCVGLSEVSTQRHSPRQWTESVHLDACYKRYADRLMALDIFGRSASRQDFRPRQFPPKLTHELRYDEDALVISRYLGNFAQGIYNASGKVVWENSFEFVSLSCKEVVGVGFTYTRFSLQEISRRRKSRAKNPSS